MPDFGFGPGFPGARVASREPRHPLKKGFQSRAPPDPFGRPERRHFSGVGPLVEEIGEAAGRAREERRRLRESVVAP